VITSDTAKAGTCSSVRPGVVFCGARWRPRNISHAKAQRRKACRAPSISLRVFLCVFASLREHAFLSKDSHHFAPPLAELRPVVSPKCSAKRPIRICLCDRSLSR
jgi:hypothetical protein